MKKHDWLFLCATVSGLIALYLLTAPAKAQETSAIDTSKLFITDAKVNAFVLQTYNRVLVGTWFEMVNPMAKTGASVSISDYPMFAPEKVRVIVKAEPTVVKRDDGAWEITFKEVSP